MSFSGDSDDIVWTTVYACSTAAEAHVIRGALEAEDIPVIIANQAMTNIIGAAVAGGVAVKVPADLEEKARRVLED